MQICEINISARVCKYIHHCTATSHIGVYDVYTWGDNSNYTLGHGRESRVADPKAVDFFRRNQTNMSMVRNSKIKGFGQRAGLVESLPPMVVPPLSSVLSGCLCGLGILLVL